MAEAQERVDSAEFAAWVALEQVEPWTLRRFDILFAQLGAVIANVFRSKKTKATKVEDLLIDWWTKVPTVARKQDVEQLANPTEADAEMMAQRIKVINAMFGGLELPPGDKAN